MAEFIDYIPEGADYANQEEEFVDYVPEPKPEFVGTPEVAEPAEDVDATYTMSMTKAELTEAAESLGVEVKSGMTKADILEAINNA